MINAAENSIFVNLMIAHDGHMKNEIEHINGRMFIPETVGASYESLADHAKLHGLYSWFVNHNLASAKQWFYLSGRLDAVSVTKPKGWNLWMHMPFIYVLLSDCTILIEEYGRLDHSGFHEKAKNPKHGEFQVMRLQRAINKDWGGVQQMLDIENEKVKKLHNSLQLDHQFFQCLVNRDHPGIEKVLAEMTSSKMHQYRNQHNVISGDFLSWPAVMFAKLAWLNGFEVRVDSPFVPMEFMPVSPLPHYDDVYDFLEPGWVPPGPEKKGLKKLMSSLFGK